MQLKEFYYIKVIADERSITKAAAKLYLAQPALTQYVHRIEEKLGHPIFVRTINGISLTPVGEEYYKMAIQILDTYHKFEEKIKELDEQEVGSFTIGASWYVQTEILSGILADFSKIYPKLELQLLEKGSIELLNMLKDNIDIDAVFVHKMVDKKLSLPSQVISKMLQREQFYLAVSKDAYLLPDSSVSAISCKNHPYIDLKAVEAIPLVRFQKQQLIRQITDQILEKAAINPPTLITTHGFQNALEIAYRNKGMIFLPERYLKESLINSYPMNIFKIDEHLCPYWELVFCYYKGKKEKIVKSLSRMLQARIK